MQKLILVKTPYLVNQFLLTFGSVKNISVEFANHVDNFITSNLYVVYGSVNLNTQRQNVLSIFESSHTAELVKNKINPYNSILVSDGEQDLEKALFCLINNRPYQSTAIKLAIIDNIPKVNALSPFEFLSSKENEIVTLLCQGQSNAQISVSLNLAYYTVKTHRKNIYRKLHISSLAQLINLNLTRQG
jgi:DNA-binding NarL/FixJ family response regulator